VERGSARLDWRGRDRASGGCAESTLTPIDATIELPGFVNAHTHTFQRALRGRASGGDFWAWREVMLAEAEGQTPGRVRASYAAAYAEMRAVGYTAVGEFHYLGLQEARAAADAAAEAGVELVLLLAAYARGGLPRMRQETVAAYLGQVEALRDEGLRVGLAPHSVRACPREWLEEIGRYGEAHVLPLHVHADEQPREIEECLVEHGCRPIELLARTGCLTARSTVVHATHADGTELDLLEQSGATVCACPTTEADLADGFLPAARLAHRRIPLCIGSDSNVRIDPLEELREIEGIARRQTGRRGVFGTERLLGYGTAEGARSLGLEAWPAIEIDLAHAAFRGVPPGSELDVLVSSCGADVVRAG
jgi:formimidoylglutamate deiminase